MSEASVEFLRSLPVGKRVWLRGLGRSMSPVFQSGDVLEVERCEPSAFRRGDVAVLAGPEDRLIAHLVVETAPLRTSSFLGVSDRAEPVLLGRVVGLRRGRVELPVPELSRTVLWRMHRALSHPRTLHANRTLRSLAGRAARTTMGTRLRRALLQPWTVRPASGADLQEAEVFAAEHGFHVRKPADCEWLLAWGAGRVQGVAWMKGSQVGGLVVSPMARRLGVGSAILEAACERAKTSGHASLQLVSSSSSELFLLSRGFTRVSPEVWERAL